MESGFGAIGTYSVSSISFQNSLVSNIDVSIFYPEDITEAVPTIFFSHGYGASDTTSYIELLHHATNVGYAIVFSPYLTTSTTIEERYNMLFDGFEKAVRDYPHIIDSTRVGFMGHSFGGGATPAMAQRGFIEKNWGENGKFMFALAPGIRMISAKKNWKISLRM